MTPITPTFEIKGHSLPELIELRRQFRQLFNSPIWTAISDGLHQARAGKLGSTLRPSADLRKEDFERGEASGLLLVDVIIADFLASLEEAISQATLASESNLETSRDVP